LDDHFFRHQYANLVALLSRKVGVQHIELVEDAVQASLLKAIETWQAETPRKPDAWLYRVAYNHLIDEFRKRQPLSPIEDDEKLSALVKSEASENSNVLEQEHDLLHMMFICCDPKIPEASRHIIALKILCGFNVKEIALRLFMSEANVHKRYQRARLVLQEQAEHFNSLTAETSLKRLESVLNVLYLLFTEGYLSYSIEDAIRRDLCEEAFRLLEILSHSSTTNEPRVYALLALMCFNLARLDTRQDQRGSLLLLEEQDRTKWDWQLIERGFNYLGSSAEGNILSRYHLEAAIAAEHCRAPSFEETNWQQICSYYEQLESFFTSYHYRLNRAVALAEWKTPENALQLLSELEPPTWMSQSYLWLIVMADLNTRCHHNDKAKHYTELALQCAPNEHIRNLISKRLNSHVNR
jgi:RNA polymerase sigma factor (sigma-70 family)